MAKKRSKLFSNWKHQYRITIFNDHTFQEVWKLRVTKKDFMTLVGSLILLLIVLVTVLIAFTPIRELIPGYPDGNERRLILMNAVMVDSIKKELDIRDRYFENMKRIISGEIPEDFSNSQDSSIGFQDITFTKSLEDSLLRKQIESEEEYSLTFGEQTSLDENVSSMFFFPPLKGLISASFNPEKEHFGTDIVGSKGSVVHSTLEGTIIMASWTLETGYVIQIQHSDNLISVYKHNKEVLTSVGTYVKAGESIAVLGNSGELYTTGPHLHFELWLSGKPIDPEKYLLF
ncbi:MAG: M23 family metallopeptidase [Bacteroidales bacterium]|nr:M23 family metallopeptidase [Bacteroidales bacterium]